MNEKALWAMCILGPLTLGFRSLFFFYRPMLSPFVRRTLSYIPVAALSALAIPAVVTLEASPLSVDLGRILAMTVAVAATLRFNHTLVTVLLGMGVLWVARYLGI